MRTAAARAGVPDQPGVTQEELVRDWIMQDYGLEVEKCFVSEGHYDANLSRKDLDKLACWIDLLVPYCGDYTEANVWTNDEKEKYARYYAKRQWMVELDERNVAMLLSDETTDETLSEHGYRNVALNAADSRDKTTSYPRATSNSEHHGQPQFAAHAAIDGQTDNHGRGGWFPLRGPRSRKDLWWQVDFGHQVAIDKVSLWVQADFPHDAHRHTATLEFSDGSRERIRIVKTAEAHQFPISQRTVTWMRISGLVRDEPLGLCGLTEVQLWGDLPTKFAPCGSQPRSECTTEPRGVEEPWDRKLRRSLSSIEHPRSTQLRRPDEPLSATTRRDRHASSRRSTGPPRTSTEETHATR